MEASSQLRRYYQVVFIRIKDPAKFHRYLELVGPIVRRYGGCLERMLSPAEMGPDGTAKPDTVNVVFYDSREAFTAFNRDPEFQSVVHLRSESIDMVAVGGCPVRGDVTETSAWGDIGRLAERIYTVEIARFGAGGADAYRSYEEQTGPILLRNGYHTERVIVPDTASELSFSPEIVKVGYFEGREGMDRVRRDAEYQRIEKELYPSAVGESIWITARMHPSTLAGTIS